MRGESQGRATQGQRWRLAARLIIVLTLGTGSGGCAYFAAQPEINPDRYASRTMDDQWRPKTSTSTYVPPPITVESSEGAPSKLAPSGLNQSAAPPANSEESGKSSNTYDLAALIDLAMRNNPAQRTAWENTRAAAAAYGS